MVGDASEAVFSAFLPGEELGPGEASCCITPFTEEQLQHMRAGQFSSAERELEALRLAVAWLGQEGRLAGRLVQYCTDSQNAFFCVLGMKGSGPNLGLVMAIYRRLFAADAEIRIVWRPRTDPQQQHADYLTNPVKKRHWHWQKALASSATCVSSVRPGSLTVVVPLGHSR